MTACTALRLWMMSWSISKKHLHHSAGEEEEEEKGSDGARVCRNSHTPVSALKAVGGLQVEAQVLNVPLAPVRRVVGVLLRAGDHTTQQVNM
jgi:hypothetical protein